jgi:hypothetical protein
MLLAGDTNADGYQDLVVGEGEYQVNVGRIFVYY